MSVPNNYIPEDPRHKQAMAQKEAIDAFTVELQRLCYEIFHMSEDGKKLWKLYEETYIVPALYDPRLPNSEMIGAYFEGFKEALRGQYVNGIIHKNRIAGVNG